ncbi:MAG: DUF3108 domain-containing protein [bacterium]
MKRCYLISSLIVFCLLGLSAGSSLATTGKFPFESGEELVLQLNYMGEPGGVFTITVDSGQLNNRPVYKLNVDVQTAGMLNSFYKIRDHATSYLDRKNLYSLGYNFYEVRADESDTEKVRYDHDKQIAVAEGRRNLKIRKFTQDGISAIYKLRTETFTVGDSVTIPVNVTGDNYLAQFLVKDKEVVRIEGAKLPAYRLLIRPKDPKNYQEMLSKLDGQASGVSLWLSSNYRHVPLKLKAPLKLGTLVARFKSYKAGGL